MPLLQPLCWACRLAADASSSKNGDDESQPLFLSVGRGNIEGMRQVVINYPSLAMQNSRRKPPYLEAEGGRFRGSASHDPAPFQKSTDTLRNKLGLGAIPRSKIPHNDGHRREGFASLLNTLAAENRPDELSFLARFDPPVEPPLRAALGTGDAPATMSISDGFIPQVGRRPVGKVMYV
jgi:hypothetical protein